jgi:lipopolysaccharide export system permease protein
VLTAFGRLSTDSEVTAMKASGISLYTLFVPVLLFSMLACGATFFLYANALPWGNHNFRVVLYKLARTKASIGLKAQVFNSTFQGLVIYIDKIQYKDNSFEGIMISDARDQKNPQIIFAQKGRLITDEKALRVILRLEQGASHPARPPLMSLKYQIVEFPTLDILLTLKDDGVTDVNVPQSDRDMTVLELYHKYVELRHQGPDAPQPPPREPVNPLPSPGLFGYLQAAAQFMGDTIFSSGQLASPYLVELHKRFSIPFACLVFGLIATPLGIQSRRAGKSGGYAISVVLLLIYYIFIAAGEKLGDDAQVSVFLSVWTPNILLGVTGVFLLRRVARR